MGTCLVTGVLLLCACGPDTSLRCEPVESFWLGVNYPWLHYGHDFGTAWDHDGVSALASQNAVRTDLENLKADGVSVVRWFIFADGRAAIDFDERGFVTRLDPLVFQDMDTALALLQSRGVKVIPVLFDYLWFEAAKSDGGVTLFGRSQVVADPARRQTLLDNAVRPFVSRYAFHPAIAAWDLINEPEWVMNEYSPSVAEPLPAAVVQEWLEAMVHLLHEITRQPVTVGSASIGTMRSVAAPLSLDIWQFHAYENKPRLLTASELSGTKPVLLGEFPTRDQDVSLSDILDAAFCQGYLGALPWSFRAGDSQSDYAAVRFEFRDWSLSHGYY